MLDWIHLNKDKRKCKDKIKTKFKKIGFQVLDWIHLDQNKGVLDFTD